MATYGDKWGYYKSTPNFAAQMTFMNLNVKYKFANGYLLTKESKVAPYLLAGAGYLKTTGDLVNGGEDFPFVVGAGLNFRITPTIAINYQATLGYLNSDSRDFVKGGDFNDSFLQHSLGLNFNFGKMNDADGDGVSDAKDKCADTPKEAKVDKTGCPLDADADGVFDYKDKCPQLVGTAATNGCPDKDRDGVADMEDDCPDVAGLTAMKGCPDTDGDGIVDSKDKCPTVKGTLEMEGCGDRDGDKIKDEADKCPDVAGLAKFNGCPDRDDDGVMDSEDLCPDKKGPLNTKGCPDSDNDGVTDNIDKCPAAQGTAANQGCPDTDKDGLHDGVDNCPNIAGPAANGGCPELKIAIKQLFKKALQGIQFETGKAIIKPVSFPILNSIAKVVIDNPTYKLTVEGHTDDVGEDEMNMTLSKDRADAVAKYLITKGADPLRVTGVGFGETKPVDTNESKAGKARNRRVELKVEFLQ
jgi:outer membrane protein OmpA-like peptidoglycan-associated protein